MYFHSDVKKFGSVLLEKVSGDESFCKEQFILRNQKELGKKRLKLVFVCGGEQVKFLSVPAQPDWT